MNELVKTTIDNLVKRNITGHYFKEPEALKNKVVELVAPGSSVIICGSVTADETGVRDYFLNNEDKYKILNPYKKGLSPAASVEIRRQGLLADVSIMGLNAITIDGEIINTDGSGNRVAGLIFGPKKVIIVCGTNKIVKNIQEGVDRIKNIAAPMNSTRLNKKTPCVKTGNCKECLVDDCICSATAVLRRSFFKDRIYVLFIEGKWGY
ncbi:MAG: lactate utilization protein [Proteobacteria bacterium]|nr:lactate utilization protein [Pseudomonadota bacterium]